MIVPGLAAFIRRNVEPILIEWEAFARSQPSGETMDISALRDHAKDMLGAIADDLESPQTGQEQCDKSKGESDASETAVPTAAQEHGAGRAESGFAVGEMIAEFRALRASVMRLWSQQQTADRPNELVDMTRFNEAIDQAIAESITQYTQDVGASKERFLAILGHDLRTPLGAVMTSTRFMLDTAAQSGDLGEPYLSLVGGVSRSARRMNQMVADLLEFARVSFGDAIPIQPAPMDLGKLCHDVVAEVVASYPGRKIETDVIGDMRGVWDNDRLFQALTNLISNAVQHGAPESAIRVKARGDEKAVCLTVANAGPAIAPEQIASMFQGMNPTQGDGARDRRHLGLGLYIVNKIVTAHGGTVQVKSSDAAGTEFTIRLPRDSARPGLPATHAS